MDLDTAKGSHPEWLMLDGFIRHLSLEDSGHNSVLAYESTSAGAVIGAALSTAFPPETSHLVFDRIPVETKMEGQRFRFRRMCGEYSSPWSPDAAKAVATHRNSILLCFLLPTHGGIQQEFFIYQSSEPMVLKRLDPCGHISIDCDTGIVSCGDESFAVAHLTLTSKEGTCLVTAQVCYMLSKEGSWCTKCVPIQHPEGKAGDLVWWETDVVVTFGESICWVDYLRGMLICDIFSTNLELRYVPLPVTPYEGNGHPEMGDRGGISAYRSVCVLQDGATIKFVDAAINNLWFSSGTCDIKSWIWKSDQVTWILDGMTQADKFVGLTSRLGVPKVQPIFPLVDMKYPHIVYFVLRTETCSGTLLVPVDMLENTLGRPTTYASRSSLTSDEGESYTSSCNLYYNEPFLPCQFSKFLGPGCASQQLV